MPVHIGIQWSSQEAARQCPKGDIELAFCHTCSFIKNIAFDPVLMEYSEPYDNSLHFSPLFQAHSQALATHLIEQYDLYSKDILEIGCGKGDFLALICKLGNNRGVGFDPSYTEDALDDQVTKQVTLIQDYFSEEHADYPTDLICCQQVLEHIDDPLNFLKMVKRTVGNRLDTVVYFDVPNVSYILRDLSVWDIIYEHCAYFSLESLAQAFTLSGFNIYNLTESYEGQLLGIEAGLNKGSTDNSLDREDGVNNIASAVAAFGNHYRNRLEVWQNRFKELEQTNKRAVIWGAGARGIGFLNMLKIQDQVKYAVDINPRKEGTYMAGSGQQIVSPQFLKSYQPDLVIVINPIYMNEIKEMVHSLGLTPQFLAA